MQIKRLENTVAFGTLTLNVVHKVSRNASVAAKPAVGGPFVVSANFGAPFATDAYAA